MEGLLLVGVSGADCAPIKGFNGGRWTVLGGRFAGDGLVAGAGEAKTSLPKRSNKSFVVVVLEAAGLADDELTGGADWKSSNSSTLQRIFEFTSVCRLLSSLITNHSRFQRPLHQMQTRPTRHHHLAWWILQTTQVHRQSRTS